MALLRVIVPFLLAGPVWGASLQFSLHDSTGPVHTAAG